MNNNNNNNLSSKISYDIHFDVNCEQDAFMLLEMTDDMLNDIINSNNEGDYSIRGQNNDNAVLCSPNQTFHIQMVESSNTQLIIPIINNNKINVNNNNEEKLKKKKITQDLFITGCVSRYFELIQIRANKHRLREILQHTRYGGEDEEQQIDKNKCLTLNELRGIIQSSDFELMNNLKELNAIELNGYWRLLYDDYYMDVIDRILDVIIEKEMSYNNVDLNVCIKLLKNQYKDVVIKHCLSTIAQKNELKNSNIYILNEEIICKLKGIQLLEKAGSDGIEEKSFMSQWCDKVPYGMIPKVSYLKGKALLIDNTIRKIWVNVDNESMSTIPKQRFCTLFDIKAQWSLEDLEPYVFDLLPPNMNLDEYLLRHCRVINVSGQDIYIAK